jgi:hypothetical protein
MSKANLNIVRDRSPSDIGVVTRCYSVETNVVTYHFVSVAAAVAF